MTDECAFLCLDYCTVEEQFPGYNCPHRIAPKEGEITWKCGALSEDLVDEEEWGMMPQ